MNDFLQSIREDAAFIIEEELGRKAVVIYSDGTEQTHSALDPEKELKCGFFQESREIDQSGYEVVSDKPVAVFSVKSLLRMPKPGERTIVKVQADAFSEELTSYQVVVRPRSGKTIGYINFQLQSISQV